MRNLLARLRRNAKPATVWITDGPKKAPAVAYETCDVRLTRRDFMNVADPNRTHPAIAALNEEGWKCDHFRQNPGGIFVWHFRRPVEETP